MLTMNKKFIWVVGLFFVIKATFLLRFHEVIWDEAVYLSIGKYIYSLGKVGLWEIIRPIGLPLILGAIWKSKLPYIPSSELTILMFSCGNIVISYLISKRIFSEKVGFYTTIFLAITPIYFLYSSYILTGIPSTFFVLLSLYLFIRDKYFLSGLFSGIASLIRFPQGLMICVLFLAVTLNFFFKKISYKKISYILLILIISFIIPYIPYFIFNYFMYEKETSYLYHALFRPWIMASWHQYNPAEILELNIFQYIFYYPTAIFKENPILILAVIGVIQFVRKNLYRKLKFNVIFIFLILYLAYFTYIPNKQLRFIVTFLPAISIFSSYGFIEILKRIKDKRILFILYLILILFLFKIFIKDINYFSWRYKHEPPIVTEYYKYFSDKMVNKILTADPVPAAYVDKKFIPIYFSLEAAKKIYNKNRDAEAVIFSPNSYYCVDEKCKSEVTELFNTIKTDFEVVFSKDYNNRKYYILIKR